ncbi:TonB-dependent receptor plug domain-containing protein [Pontibacter ramchanderi]|uniref:Hemoglobin/transferrin/lactoferrin receptor protein n=1 Tax=Pontibacter ramchanderi TaxID=1179743 RepID=A0A2N3U8V0_9BACT|nr:TonB-dependent receptor [Pontibacter ramchanderi]PKV63154.1 hemoglobin/transferrin/lactoferrin receptor protein [Pontibacter ramchanderi]
MRKLLFLIGGLCLLPTATFSQILTVRDQVTQQPLEMVQLSGKTSDQIHFTDRKGQVDISSFSILDSLVVRLVGYDQRVMAYAQLERQGFELYLHENNISLRTVVVSATRWQQDAKEVPQRVSTIESKDVQLQQPQTAADMLGQAGEVYIQKSQGGGGSPMIRGFAANRVLLAVDGVRMNTAIFRSGNLQNVISLDPFAIAKTEVLFGPGSVMFGSDAIGGVMNFYTLTPAFATDDSPLLKGSATTRWSSANREKTGHLDLRLGFKEWAFLTSATFSDFGDLRMGAHGPDDYLRKEYVRSHNGQDEVLTNTDPRLQVRTGYEQLNLMQKIRYRPGENWDLQYGFHYATTSDVPRYDRLTLYKNGKLRSAEWYYGPQVWAMQHLQARRQAGSKFFDQLNIGLAYQLFEESRHNRDLGKPTRYNRYEKVNAFSANLDFEKALDKRHHLFYGLEAIYNKVASTGTDENNSTGDLVPGPSRYPNGADWSSYASFLTYRFKAGEKLTVLTGARYNHVLLHADFDKRFYNLPFTSADINAGAVTGSAGLVYSAQPSWQLSSNLSTGFRSPNVDDIGKIFDSAPGLVVVPNPDLRPEYAYNADLGFAKTFGDVLKLDATAFYTYLQDALVRRDYTLSGQSSIEYEGEWSQVQAIQNAAFVRVWGVQAGIEMKLPAGFGLSSRYNLQRGREELDNGTEAPLRHAAPSFGLTRLTYTRNRLKADVYAQYNGAIRYSQLAPEEQDKAYLYAADANGNPYSPAWATLNLKARYQLSQHLAASAGIENITNVRYRPYSSGIVAPGRNFILSLRASF